MNNFQPVKTASNAIGLAVIGLGLSLSMGMPVAHAVPETGPSRFLGVHAGYGSLLSGGVGRGFGAGVSYSYYSGFGYRFRVELPAFSGGIVVASAALAFSTTHQFAPGSNAGGAILTVLSSLFRMSFGLGAAVGINVLGASNHAYTVLPGLGFDFRFKIPKGEGSYPLFFEFPFYFLYGGGAGNIGAAAANLGWDL